MENWITGIGLLIALAVFIWRRVSRWLPVHDVDYDTDYDASYDAPAPYVTQDDALDYCYPADSDEWCDILNHRPNDVPHVAVVGPSGSGKSTFVLALLHDRPGQLVITTIKNAEDDPWGGFPATRLSFAYDADGYPEPDWSGIADAILSVYREVNARHADGARPRTPLTLVVDELTATIGAIGKAVLVPRLIHLWLTARSVNVRLIVMDPTANAEGWGLTGRGDVRESIAFVRCERDKSAMIGSLEEIRSSSGIELLTHNVPALAASPLSADRLWRAVGHRAAQPVTPALALNPPTAATTTPYETAMVREWYEDGDHGMRSLARRLYAARGGQPPYDGSGGPYYAVKQALGVSAETLSTAL